MGKEGSGQGIRVADLGPLEVHLNGAVIELRGRRAQLLAARLLVAGEVGVATGDLIDSIWPTAARPPTARHSLANTVAQLRKRADGLIETTTTGYRIGTRPMDRQFRYGRFRKDKYAVPQDFRP